MEEYRNALTAWYKQTKRELPWRGCLDPYKIWVSEVILQQTRVQQGLDYYHTFLRLFPNVKSLALAPEEEVLKAWQGLGYYSRARNMHHAAKTILSEFGGKFPNNYESIRNLKGIGDYTAAAIASIAFNQPYAVVDGNVFRVLSRLFGVETPIDTTSGKKEFYKLAQMMLDTAHPGDSNQALMEFGAIQCLPGQPLCSDCPLSGKCYAFTNNSIGSFPVKSKLVKQKERYLNYLYLFQEEKLILERRGDRDIWRNMFQFPLIETTAPASSEEVIGSVAWNSILTNQAYTIETVYPEKIHLLTHQRLHIRFFSIHLNNIEIPFQFIAVNREDITRFPVPKPIENFLKKMGH